MKVAFLSSFPPKHCGVGQFCSDLIQSLLQNDPTITVEVFAIDNIPEGYIYPPIVKHHFYYADKQEFTETARTINSLNPDITVVQHEFGLYGEGEQKTYIYDFLREIHKPVVVILHSVPIDPLHPNFHMKKEHILTINQWVTHFVTISDAGKEGLIKLGVPPHKISVIGHGAPQMPSPDEKKALKLKFGYEDSFLVFEFGLFHKMKGLHILLDALGSVSPTIPNLKCLLMGPPLTPDQESYLIEMQKRILAHRLSPIVSLQEVYLERKTLLEYIVAADVIVTPYLGKNQTSSGVLTFSVAGGTPVISTPYPYAQSLLKDIGILIPYNNSRALAAMIQKLATDPQLYQDQHTHTLALGKTLSWNLKAKEYRDLFLRLLSS